MKNILELKNIGKKYQAKNGEIEALKNVNLKVQEGEFVSIIGPSRMWKIYIIVYYSRFRKANIRRSAKKRRNWLHASNR